MPARFTLGKNERLKRRKVIEQLFREGKSVPGNPVRAHYLFGSPLSNNLQAGFSASARQFKKAVDRNRIKRLMREAYRLQKNELHEKLVEKKLQLAVFFIYTGKEIPVYKTVDEKITVLLNKLIRVVNEMAVTGS